MMPKRIQRQRTKGWRMPPNAVYVGRPSKWGNVCKIGSLQWLSDHLRSCTAEEAVMIFRHHARVLDDTDAMRELRGKDLVCYCSLDQPCHADVLLEIANASEVK